MPAHKSVRMVRIQMDDDKWAEIQQYGIRQRKNQHTLLGQMLELKARSQTSASVSPKSTSNTNSSRNTGWKELRSRAHSLIGGSTG